MLIESAPTIVYASSWYQTAILSVVTAGFGGTLVWLAKRTLKDVEELKKTVTDIRVELPTKYKTIEQCQACKPIELVKPVRAKKFQKAAGE